MPFIETKTSVKLTEDTENKLKEAYGKDMRIRVTRKTDS